MTKKEKWEFLDVMAVLLGFIPITGVFIYLHKYHSDTIDLFGLVKMVIVLAGILAVGLRQVKNHVFKDKDITLAYVVEHIICWLMSFLIAGILFFLIMAMMGMKK